MFGWPDLFMAGVLGFLVGFLSRRTPQQRPPDPPPDRADWWKRGEDPPGYGD